MNFTKEQLDELGFRKYKDGKYYNDGFEYQFNPDDNQLIFFDDGFGANSEPLVKIKDLEHFKQVLMIL